MTDRTTINVAKFAHQEAKKVKENDPNTKSWNDVLAFYAEYRPKVSNGGLGESNEPMQEVDTSDLEREIKKLQELVEKVPRDTAEELR